jgi:hypothetical protein
MRKVSEYRAHADECRRLAAITNDPEHRQQLTQMADTWEMLAQARARQLMRAGKIPKLSDPSTSGSSSSDTP